MSFLTDSVYIVYHRECHVKVFGSPGVNNLLGAVLFFFAVSHVSHKWLDSPVVECIERSWVRVSPAVILSMALMLIMVANIFETCVLCGKVLLCWLYNGSLLSPFALFMGAFWKEAFSESCNNYTNNIIINNGKNKQKCKCTIDRKLSQRHAQRYIPCP